MRRALFVFLLAATTAGAMISDAAAGVYKWTDAKGIVNYGNAPPPEAQAASPVDLTRASFSTYPRPVNEIAYEQELRMRGRMARFEAESRSARAYRGVDARLEDRQRAYDQCLQDRRVDCERVRSDPFYPSAPWLVIARPVVRSLLPTVTAPVPAVRSASPAAAASLRSPGTHGSRALLARTRSWR